eukprot:g541.t1
MAKFLSLLNHLLLKKPRKSASLLRSYGKSSSIPSSCKSALVLIDLQKDYVSGGDLLYGQTSTLLEAFPDLPGNVENLLYRAREKEMPVVHVRERDCEQKSVWLRWWDQLHPHSSSSSVGLGIKSSPEDWSKEIEGEKVFIKHTYDMFGSGKVSEDLLTHLNELGVQRLYLAGCLTKACVMFSANSAFGLGFEVFVLEDGCADRTRRDHEKALSLYDGYHIRVVKIEDIEF